MKKHIPNFLTCCNLLCGSLGIVYLLEEFTKAGKVPVPGVGLSAALFVWVSCIFDFFDGFAARALKVSSPIGKELDSLADVVSFGLLPAVFMYIFIGQQTTGNSDIDRWLPYTGFIIVAFSALRLAIFNVDETQKDSFRGLPTPANALFLTGLPAFSYSFTLVYNPWFLAIIAIVFSLLLVSRVELFALKFKNFSWGDNKIRFTFLLLSVLLMLALQQAAIPLIIVLYIALSLTGRAFAR